MDIKLPSFSKFNFIFNLNILKLILLEFYENGINRFKLVKLKIKLVNYSIKLHHQ